MLYTGKRTCLPVFIIISKENVMKSKRYKILGVMLFIFSLITPLFYININAASKFTLSNGKTVSSVLYTNHSYTLKVRNQSVYFYSSRPSLVEVNKRTGKLLVKEPGTVTISARRRTTSQLVCKTTFTVRRRSDYIVPSVRSFSLVTGQTHKLSVKKSPSNSTDVIRYKSSNTSVVTVNSITGAIKAVGIGSASITAYSKADASVETKSSSNRTVRVTVKVYSSITSAKQIGLSEVRVGFQDTPSKLSKNDFSIYNSSGKVVSVSGVTSENKYATLSLSQNLLDGKVYTVKYKSSKFNFTACDGIIRRFEFLTTKVPINTETPIVAYAYDKNDIQLGEYEYGQSYSGITFTVSSSYLKTNKKLNFTSPNGTAIARIYYKAPGSSSITADSGNVTITGYDPEMISAQYRCTITNTPTFTFTDTTSCNYMLPKDSGNYYAYFNITTSSKKEISDYSKYTVSSGNTNILILQSNTINSSDKSVGLFAVNTGTTYIYLKDSSGYTVATFPVTVCAPAKLTSVALSKTVIPLVNTASNGEETITVTAKDQYGNAMDPAYVGACYLECVSSPANFVSVSDVNNNSSIYWSCNYPNIIFNNYNIAPGNYTYKVYVGEKYTTVNVIVNGVAPSTNP